MILKKGKLKAITHGDFAIMLESNAKYVVAIIVDGETHQLRRQLRKFSAISENFAIDVNDPNFEKTVESKLEEKIRQVF